jgi:hypothetical protein
MDIFAQIEIILKIFPFLEKWIHWIVKQIKWHGISENARETAFAFNSYSWTYLQQAPPSINYIGVIERPEIDQIRRYWHSDNVIVLHGEAGTGKSGIALRLGQLMANNGIPTLFIKATDLPSNQDPILTIQHRMPLKEPLLDSIARLCNERECVIIVDQLDSVAGTDLSKNLVGFIKAIVALPKVKILVVSRTYELQHDSDISSLDFPKIESGQLILEQVISFLSQIGIKSPSQALIELARNLLNLSLIAEVAKSSTNPILDLTDDIDLWKEYYLTIQQHESEEIAEFVLKLAQEVTSRGEQTFSVSFPKSEYRRKLLSRGILIEAPGRRYAFRHEQLQDFLCAYSLLPEKPDFARIFSEFGQNTSKGVISWLQKLYHMEFPNLEARFIADVLAANDNLPFYSRTPVLENLREQLDPTVDSAKIIIKYSNDWAYNRFFFDGLDNPAWITPLFETGFFSKPPEPIEIKPGSFQLPGWPAGEYLARFADQHEDIVVAVVRSIRTENWRVQEILVDAMLKISPEKTAELISTVDAWFGGRFSDMLPNKLIPLADYLLENGLVDGAIQILEYVITPVLPPIQSEYSKYRSAVSFRSDRYWVNEYSEKQLSKLIQLKPVNVVLAFDRQVKKTIELTKQVDPENAELQVGYYWRMDIPNHLSEWNDADALDILIDGLRDSLAEVCKQNTEEGRKFLTDYLNSEHVIFKRIALYILRTFGQNYPELINQALLQRDYLENSEYAKEYCGLMRDQFNTASEEVRSQVISWILSGPTDVDARAIRHAQWQNREATEEDRREIREKWVLFRLEIIRDFLTGDALSRLNELTARHGKPDITERPAIVTTSLGGALSPLSAEELSQKSFEDIKRFFLTYIPEDLFLNPRESLAQTFQKLVSEDPGKFNVFASFLADPAIRFVYVYHYLSGVREGIKNKDGKLTNEILSLCEYIMAQKDDAFVASSGDHEPGLFAAQMEVAHLLEEALHSNDPYLTREQLDRIRSLLITLAHHSDPESDADSNTSFDPFIHSLNCVRGEAMHGIFHYSLYLSRQQDKLSGEKSKEGHLEPEIQQILDEKLDLTVDPSLAVHSVYGAFVPQLHFLSHEWLENNLLKIFPEEEDKDAFWKAAWDAYIFASNVYRDVFKLLIPQYQRGLRLLRQPQNEEKHFGGSPNERLVQHIMFAYLAGLTDFGHENQLLDLFFENASDVIRAQGVFWLNQVLENGKPAADDILWKKCWTLWQKRLEFAETQEVNRNTQEISDYLRWLVNSPVDLEFLFPTLQKSVKYLHDGFDTRQLIEYASKQCDQFPLYAVTLLQMAILAAKEVWWTPRDEDEEKILQVAMASKNEEARKIAIGIINYRGELGDFRWKYLLENK